MSLLFEKKLIAFTLFFSLLVSSSHAESLQEQYDAIQNSTNYALNVLNHEFFDKLHENIQCTASQPVLLTEESEKIRIGVDYKCTLNPFDVNRLDGFTATKEEESVDLKQNDDSKFNMNIVDEYFERVQTNYIIKIGLSGTKYEKKQPFFYSNYTENVNNIILMATSIEDHVEFEVPKNQLSLIKNSSITIGWINENPYEILNNIGFLKQNDIEKIIERNIKATTRSYYTFYNCAESQEVKNLEDMQICSMATLAQAFGGPIRSYNFSRGKKVIYPVDRETLNKKMKTYLTCLNNLKLKTRRFKNEKEIENIINMECPTKGSDVLKLPKK